MINVIAIKDLLDFIRFKICFSASVLAIVGYLLINSFDNELIFVSLASFLVTAVGYGYNNITDKKEDLINRKKINTFASGYGGLFILAACFLAGAIFSFLISDISFFIYVILSVIGILYSFIRVKQHILVKNLYTSFTVGLLYLFGCFTAYNTITATMLHGYFSVVGFVLIGTLIADLRDLKGDRNAGVKTIPVCIGCAFTKYVIYFLMLADSAYILILGLYQFYIILPFFLLEAFILKLNNYHLSHLCCVYSFVFLAIWLIGVKYILKLVIP